MKRIILLAAVVAIVAATLAASSILSIGSAQEEAAGKRHICAPWSKAGPIGGAGISRVQVVLRPCALRPLL